MVVAIAVVAVAIAVVTGTPRRLGIVLARTRRGGAILVFLVRRSHGLDGVMCNLLICVVLYFLLE